MGKTVGKRACVSILVLIMSLGLVAGGCGPKKSELTEDRLIGEIVLVVPAPAYDPVRYECAVLAADGWEALGLKVKLEPMDFTALSNRAQTAPWDWDTIIAGYVSRPERLDPDVLLYRPFHSSTNVDQGSNYAGYMSAEFDRAVEAQRVEMDLERRRQLVWECQAILAEDAPAVALYHVTEVHVYNNRTFTDFTPMTGQGNWNIWSVLSARPIAAQKYIRLGTAWDIDSLNPFAATGGGNIEFMRLMHDMLARVGSDGKPTPWAAESWKVVNSTTIDVKLRSGMKFHDGVPVTAADVKFSYDFVKKWEDPILAPFVQSIDSVDVVDDLNLRFNLKAPYPAIFQTTFSQVYILPKHIWEDVCAREKVSHPREWKVTKPVGSGPFKFGQWRVGQESRWDRNPDHFNPPVADGLLHVVHGNPDAIFMSLKEGRIDMHDRRLLPVHIEESKTVPHLTQLSKPDFGVYYLAYNMRRAPFDDRSFRQALSYAIDYGTIVDTLLRGYGEPGRGFIAPANVQWHNPNQRAYTFDLDKARRILKDAGYEWDAEGRLYLPPQ